MRMSVLSTYHRTYSPLLPNKELLTSVLTLSAPSGWGILYVHSEPIDMKGIVSSDFILSYLNLQ